MTGLSTWDWNFDDVPDRELAACCYWEYARESAFIRDLRKRSWECWKPLYMEAPGLELAEEQVLHRDLQLAQTISYPAEVFLRGMSFPPEGEFPKGPPRGRRKPDPLTGGFPKPWQTLAPKERASRAHIGTDVERVPLVPFKRGHQLDARDIDRWATARGREHQNANLRAQAENPGKSEEQLLREGKLHFPDIQPSLFWAGGSEVTVVAIQWADFTNEQIAAGFRRWLKSNRPKDAPGPNGKGHKPGDWRAKLTRLAVMRLLARATASKIVDDRKDAFPAIWTSAQFSGPKWTDVNKWYEARREAAKTFGKLFPFLPKGEKPMSWNRRSPGK